MILPVGNNAAFNRSHDCCCQTLSFFVSAYFLRCKLLGLISPSPHCFPHSDSVASTWIWRVGTSGNVILTFFFFSTWPAAFVSNLLLAKRAGLKQICADHRSLPDVPSADFSLGFYHLCSSPPSGFITQHFCFFMSEYIWCGLNLFQLTQPPANTTVKPLYGSGMPWNLHTLDFLLSVSHHSLLCPFHLSTSPAISCFSTAILT